MILAAGSSSRLGRPKQQLTFNGSSLLERSIQAGLNCPCTSVSVVLGAYHQEILQRSDLSKVKPIIHSDWHLGMGSTIKAGLKALLQEDEPDQIIFMLCDQPFVDGELLANLISVQQESGKGVVACQYKQTLGVPALFTQPYFPVLLKMEDAEGAKKILEKSQWDLATVPFQQGGIDIDTEEDYQHFLDNN